MKTAANQGFRSRIRPWPPQSLPVRRWMLIILLAAAALRFNGINNISPPGLAHDEVANWLIDRSILDGNHAIYFTAAYGHEAGFHYLQAAFVGLLGDHALALRLPAAFSGLLLTAVSFALTRRLFGSGTALFSAALLATLFWPVFFSRLGLRAISLPLISGLSAYFWWRGWAAKHAAGGAPSSGRRLPWSRSSRSLAYAGVFAGLSLYTYMAARSVPIFYGLFLVYLMLFHRAKLKRQWQGVTLFLLLFALVAAPLLLYLASSPGSEFRISEIDAPLRALRAGDLRPVINNGLKIIGAFGFAGDPLWRQNVAGLPLFDPLIASLFYLSLPLALYYVTDGRYAFLLLWLTTGVTPSLVTIDAPSSIRIINILPILTIFPGLLIHNSGHLSTVIDWLSTEWRYRCSQLGLLLLILYSIVLTSRAIYQIWPGNEEVQFVWQQGLTDAARLLDRSGQTGPVAIGGWSPGTMDPPTMALSLIRDDLALSFFDPTHSLIIPAAEGTEIRILHPTILEVDPILADKLEGWGASTQVVDSFTLYTLSAAPSPRPQLPAETEFGRHLRFLGMDRLEATTGSLEMVTYWQAMEAGGPRRLFIHLLDENGTLLAEDYAFDEAGSRSQGRWQPGDLILAHHTFDMGLGSSAEAAPVASVRLGLYDPDSCPPFPCRNLPTGEGAQFLQIAWDGP